MYLQKELEKYQYADLTNKQIEKVVGDIKPGSKLSIKWKGRNLKDKGYVFVTPDCDNDLYVKDLFVHIPFPSNEDGMDSSPAAWCHLNSLLLNEDCLEVFVIYIPKSEKDIDDISLEAYSKISSTQGFMFSEHNDESNGYWVGFLNGYKQALIDLKDKV